MGTAEPAVSVSRGGGGWGRAWAPLPPCTHRPNSALLAFVSSGGCHRHMSCVRARVYLGAGRHPDPVEDCGDGTSLCGAPGAAVLGCLAFCRGAWVGIGGCRPREASGRDCLPQLACSDPGALVAGERSNSDTRLPASQTHWPPVTRPALHGMLQFLSCPLGASWFQGRSRSRGDG